MFSLPTDALCARFVFAFVRTCAVLAQRAAIGGAGKRLLIFLQSRREDSFPQDNDVFICFAELTMSLHAERCKRLYCYKCTTAWMAARHYFFCRWSWWLPVYDVALVIRIQYCCAPSWKQIAFYWTTTYGGDCDVSFEWCTKQQVYLHSRSSSRRVRARHLFCSEDMSCELLSSIIHTAEINRQNTEATRRVWAVDWVMKCRHNSPRVLHSFWQQRWCAWFFS